MSTQQKLPDLEQVFAASLEALECEDEARLKRKLPLHAQTDTPERRQKMALEEAAQSLARLWKLPRHDRLPSSSVRRS
jgi:hypothetical protein